MPLFAAYSRGESDCQSAASADAGPSWLQSSSFQLINDIEKSVGVTRVDQGHDDHDDDEKDVECEDSWHSGKLPKKAKKHKKEKKKKHKKSQDRDDAVRSGKEKAAATDAVKRSLLIPIDTVFSTHHKLRPDEAFYTDKKGDRNNLAFSNMYFKNVPKYFSSNGILGGKPFIKPKQKLPARYYSRRAMKRIAQVTTHIPVSIKRSEDNPLGVYDISTLLYIQGVGSAPSIDSKVEEESEEREVNRKSALYNEKLRKEPHNTDLWLEFVEFQDKSTARFLLEKEKQDDQKQKVNQRAVLERKVSILDKAIELNPKCIGLIVTRLHIVSQFWESESLQQEWRNTLFVHPVSMELWHRYLSFSETYFEDFSVPNVLKNYSSCIHKLVQMQQPSFSSHQRPKNLDENMIDIFTRLCVFLCESGLTEKSISLYQAMMELHRPGLYQNDIDGSFSTLQSFWNSGTCRFGERLSGQGVQARNPACDLSDREGAILEVEGQSQPVTWHSIETLRSLHQWRACSPLTPDDQCDDVERIISFPDIAPYLFTVDRSDHVQYRLVVGFLQSLKVPLLPGLQSQASWAPVECDQDLSLMIRTLPKLISLATRAAPTLWTDPAYLVFIRCTVLECWTILKDPYRLELILWWLDVERMRIGIQRKEPGWKSVWKDTKKWVKDFLKAIPSSDVVATLALYRSYADMESEAGNPDEGIRVLQMLLSMHSGNPFQQEDARIKSELLRLWLSYAHLLMAQDLDSTLAYFVALGSGSGFASKAAPATPSSVLKARRWYEALYEGIVKDRYAHQVRGVGLFHVADFSVDFLACYSYLLCFSNDTSSAVKVVRQCLKCWKDQEGDDSGINGRFEERFVQYHCRREMVYINLLRLLTECSAMIRNIQPRWHSDVLVECLEEYPTSLKILSVLIDSEAEHCSMFSQLWKTVARNCKSKPSARSVIAALLALAKRGEAIIDGNDGASRQDGLIHQGYYNKIWSLVSNSVNQYPARNSVFLWRVLMRCANYRKDFRECQTLFYRAVRDCPWSKDLFMDAVEYVPALIKEAVGLMCEKELRLRFPLEELGVLLEPEEDLTATIMTGIEREADNEINSDADSEDRFSRDYDEASDE